MVTQGFRRKSSLAPQTPFFSSTQLHPNCSQEKTLKAIHKSFLHKTFDLNFPKIPLAKTVMAFSLSLSISLTEYFISLFPRIIFPHFSFFPLSKLNFPFSNMSLNLCWLWKSLICCIRKEKHALRRNHGRERKKIRLKKKEKKGNASPLNGWAEGIWRKRNERQKCDLETSRILGVSSLA